MNALANLISLAMGVWLALRFGLSLTALFGWWNFIWLGYLLVFFAGYLATNLMLSALLGAFQLSGGGIWTASPVRWVVGKAAFVLLVILALWIVGLFLPIVGVDWSVVVSWMLHPVLAFSPPDLPPSATYHDRFVSLRAPVGRNIIWTAIAVSVVGLIPLEKRVIASVTRPLRLLLRAAKAGVGGSSAFNGLLDEWLMPWRPAQILLGTSMYEPGQKLGRHDDRHFITIATSRSGKGRSAVVPNLLTWPGSALVIDPKGENAAITARERRNDLGQTVHIVDPFGLLQRLGLDGRIYGSQRFNPLAEINLADLDVVEQIRNLGAALVMPSPHANPFWDNAARQILAGIIAHVLTSPKLRDDERHLGTVRDYVAETNGRKLTDMVGNMAAGGLAAIAANELKRASDSAGGDILTTLNVHMEWMDSLAMRQAFAVSDFSLSDMKNKDTTLYLVIPPEYLGTHARYLRLFITMALRAAGRGRASKHAMLFILDEFAALGELKVVAEAAAQLAGMGVKLWPIIQNLTQLRPYGDDWEVFLANAGQIQVFSMNDQATARYFSERLGQHIAWRKVRSRGGGYEWVPQGPAFLRTSVELARESSRDSGKALIFFEGGDAAVVRRAPYDFIFTDEQYSPNPYQTAPALFSRAGYRAAGDFRNWSERLMEEFVWERLGAWNDQMDQKIKTWEEQRTPQIVLAGPVAPPAVAPGMPAVPGDSNTGPEADVTPGPPLDAEAMAQRDAEFDELWAEITGEKPPPPPKKPRRTGRTKGATKTKTKKPRISQKNSDGEGA